MPDWIRNAFSVLFKNRAAAWTAVFTGILTWTTINLMCLNQRANETNVASQRAFLNFQPLQANKVSDKNSNKLIRMNFNIGWYNSGTTPTKTAIAHSNIQPWSTELPQSFGFEDLPESKEPPISKSSPILVGPKSTVIQTVGVPIDDVLDIRRKNHHLYLWGWVLYQDIFPHTPVRLSNFCVEIVNVVIDKDDWLDPTANFNWDMVPCPVNHNCYDEDCKDYSQRINKNAPDLSRAR